MIRALVIVAKALWELLWQKPDQQFINELVKHEQSRHYQRHFGIGHGPHALPPGRFLGHGEEPFRPER